MDAVQFAKIMDKWFRFNLEFSSDFCVYCKPMQLSYTDLRQLAEDNFTTFDKYDIYDESDLVQPWYILRQLISALEGSIGDFTSQLDEQQEADVEGWLPGYFEEVIGTSIEPIAELSIKRSGFEVNIYIGGPCTKDIEVLQIVAFLDFLSAQSKFFGGMKIDFLAALEKYVHDFRSGEKSVDLGVIDECDTAAFLTVYFNVQQLLREFVSANAEQNIALATLEDPVSRINNDLAVAVKGFERKLALAVK